MSVTGGFFNSLSGDRRYDAEQLCSIFDGVITEGVFEHYGDCFKITTSGLVVTIGSGRAWLNSKWLLNNEDYSINLRASDPVNPRYDAIVLDMDSSLGVRANTIKLLTGVASASPAKPSMIFTGEHRQYPLCYIYRSVGQTAIAATDIELMVGRGTLPYVTAPLTSISIQDHYNRWNTEFNNWFGSMKYLLSGNTAVILQNQIDALNTKVTDSENEHGLTDVTTPAYRKSYAGTTDMVDGTTPLADGVIYMYYEE